MIGHYSQLAHQGIADPSRSMANGGGGGGSDTPDTRYANLDALYGVQKQASEYMLSNAMPHIPGLTQNSSGMVDEAMSGRLADRARGRAAADADAAMGTSTEAMNMNLSRYGINPNSGLFADMARKNAVEGAANKVSAMGKASQWAEDQKWNRNANFYGQVMGMNNGAMQGISSSGAGMSGIANAQNANDLANAKGYGQAGSAFASALTKADGGYIKAPKLAAGGDAWEAYKAANPVQPMSSSGGKKSSGLKAMLGGASPQLLGAGLKDVFSDKSKIVSGAKKVYDSGKSAYDTWQAAQAAQEYADAAQTINDGVSAAQTTVDAIDAANAVGAGVDAVNTVGTGVEVADTINSGVQAAEAAAAVNDAANAVSAASEVSSLLAMKNGGSVKKHNAFALGGMAKSGVANMNTVDNQSMAKMDASSEMSVAKMGTSPKSATETHSKLPQGQFGKTDGMGEGSSNDPDGFGKEGADNRHLAGKATMSVVGAAMGIPGLGAVADAIHPIMEPLTREMVMAGDKMGGVAGAMTTDPAGAIASGKYSTKDLIKGAGLALSGNAWAGKFLADGGRVDHTDGGDVQGPGTETSDDIPAWLSDGEYVLNAEAVKMVGKDKLEKINDAGLEQRENRFACGGAIKKGVKLAGGGFLGGNLGIAMGAGVDQWNKQQVIDQRDQEIAMHKEQAEQQRQINEMKIAEVARGIEKEKKAETVNSEVNDKIGSATALNATLKGLKGDEYRDAFKAYSDAGMTPSDLYRQAGVTAGAIDAGKNMQFSQYADGLVAQEKKDAATNRFQSALSDPSVTEEQLARLQADIDVDKGMTNIVGMHKSNLINERTTRLAGEKADLQRELFAAKYLNGDGSPRKKPGGDKDEGHGILDKLASDNLKYQGVSNGASTEITGLELHPIARTMYSDITGRPGNKLSPERASHMAVELAKSSKGIPSEYTKHLIVDENGDFSVTARNTAGRDDAVLSRAIGNPESFMGGTNEEKAKALTTRRSDAAFNFFGSKEKAHEAAKMSPTDVARLTAEFKEKNPTANADAFAARLSKFVEHAKVYAKENTLTQKAEKQSSNNGRWFDSDMPTENFNDEGSPNIVKNAYSRAFNVFADSARKARE